jgi:hypothetical protein
MLQLADPKLKLKCLVILHKIPDSPPFTLHQERIVPPLLKESDAQKIFLWKVRLCHVMSSPNLTLSSHSNNQKKSKISVKDFIFLQTSAKQYTLEL